MGKKLAYISFLIILLNSCTDKRHHFEVQNLVKYVDTRIGVIDNRLTECVIGPQLPFGSINPSPQSPESDNDGYIPGKPVRGFGQLHVSGTGWGKYGHFLISPQVGLRTGADEHDSPVSDELGQPSLYSCKLTRYGITTEIVPSEHCALYSFDYPVTDSAYLVMDVTHSLTRDIATYIKGRVYACQVKVDAVSNQAMSGFIEYEGGFGSGKYSLYFYATLSAKASEVGVWKNASHYGGRSTAILSNPEDRIGCFFRFRKDQPRKLMMKLAISFKSCEKAKSYLDQEISGWNPLKQKAQADQIWNKALSSILLEGASEKQCKLFYTALYHAMLMPRNRTGDFKQYADSLSLWDDHYAIWDTWRTVFPLMELIKPDMVRDNVNSFLNRYQMDGTVRDAFVAGNEMYAEQGGNNVDNVIASAILKDIPGIDQQAAYQFLKHNADFERKGYQGMDASFPFDPTGGSYKELGWIPGGIMSCSISLEYSYNDFCLAMVAKKLGKQADYLKYIHRSGQWVNLWNPQAESHGFKGFICPKDNDGKWLTIDPAKNPGSWMNYYYEANAWTYSLFVPHQIDSLIVLNGGEDKFAAKLNYALKNNLIELANEPSFLAVRMFNNASRMDLANYWIHYIRTHLFDETGGTGNDDSGAMSAWYIFSAIGIFPNAGQNDFYVNTPFCRKIILQREGGDIIINAPQVSEKNIYVKSFSINGKKYSKPVCSYEDLKKGARLDFEITDQPVKVLK